MLDKIHKAKKMELLNSLWQINKKVVFFMWNHEKNQFKIAFYFQEI